RHTRCLSDWSSDVCSSDLELFGVVAETLTRGRLNVRLERAGRPEVPNLMLAPKQFDPVNRDLEIRDLYNMDDAFHLSRAYENARSEERRVGKECRTRESA